MLAAPDAPRFLLERGLIGPDAVVDDDLVVRESSRRNCNMRVERTGGASYFVKQSILLDDGRTASDEARIIGALAAHGGPVAHHLPRLVDHEPDEQLIVLEMFPDHESLLALQASAGRIAPDVAAAVGAAVAHLHRTSRIDLEPAVTPWGLGGHRPGTSALRELTPSGLAMIRMLQGSGLADRLAQLRAEWQEGALVHGDLSWQNLLVTPSRHGEPPRVSLIDWESAGVGDPAWDIGYLLAGFVSAWLFSIPAGGEETDTRRMPALATTPLEALQPSMRACWDGYRGGLGPDGDLVDVTLGRVVRFAAAGLVQIAYGGAHQTKRPTGSVILHLQVAANMLDRPDEAAADLLGLSWRESR